MATSGQGRIMSERVPFPLDAAECLSWDLGAELVERKSECARLERADGGSLTAFEATDHTVVVRVRTAVGREKFYGLADADFRAALTELPTAWQMSYADV
ncbi:MULTISPECIES: hypothetical protein [Halobacterium]|uniref:hypothetical protein n=1 Tax=Halobacterium TaxID=2239 RepID=UPI00073E7FC8|nr:MULTISPECIES: hypothetical protein [Halobacterium]MCG1002229.1 hypothetical protein [Halobacterium noricense]